MVAQENSRVARRGFIIGAGAAGLLALPGCASMGGYSLVEVVRRLLMRSADNAFARLIAPGGFWDSQVARIDLPEVFGARGGIAQSILTSPLFRDRLQRQLNGIAERGAERAAPVVADAVRTIGIANAQAIIRGGPSAATGFLRDAMGDALIAAMIPPLEGALRVANDPILMQAIGALVGVDLTGVARSVSGKANDAIWSQIALEESLIRANPGATNDPMLIAALKAL